MAERQTYSGEHDPNQILRNFITSDTGPADWPHREKLADLYRLSDIISFLFYSPKDEAQASLPPIILGIGPMRADVYAGYYLQRNELGLRYLINLNELHIERPWWSLAETLTHELGHVVQEEVLRNGSKPPYHNKVFVDMMADLGIHAKLNEGYHFQPADLDGQFGRLMDMLCVAPPPPQEQARPDRQPGSGGRIRDWWEGGSRPRGSSTLLKYVAEECTRTPTCSIRAGRKDLAVQCLNCGGQFRPEIAR